MPAVQLWYGESVRGGREMERVTESETVERATYRGREGGFQDIIDNFLYIKQTYRESERERDGKCW